MRYDDAYREDCRLDDGTPVALRLLRPSDREGLRRAFAELSPASRYRRFFVETPELTEAALDYLTDVDNDYHMALVALAPTLDLKEERGVGIARYVRLAREPDVAELAVTVVDAMQGRGLARLLLSRLVEAARERHVRRLRAELLPDNRAMARALLRAGAALVEDRGDTLVYDLPLAPLTKAPARPPLPLRWLLRAAFTSLARLAHWLSSPAPDRPPWPALPAAPDGPPPRPRLAPGSVAAVACADGGGWLAAPDGPLLRSFDGGRTWAPALVDASAEGGVRVGEPARPLVAAGPRGAARAAADVTLLDAWDGPKGLYAAAGELLHSDDGGRSWRPAGPPGALDVWAGGARGDALFALGAGGSLHHSADGGRAWTALPPLPGPGPWRALAPWGDGLVAAGESAALYSDDDGSSWRPLEAAGGGGGWRAAWVDRGGALVLAGPRRALVLDAPHGPGRDVPPAATLLPIGGGRLLATDDGGQTWRPAGDAGGAPGLRGWAFAARPPGRPAAPAVR